MQVREGWRLAWLFGLRREAKSCVEREEQDGIYIRRAVKGFDVPDGGYVVKLTDRVLRVESVSAAYDAAEEHLKERALPRGRDEG